MADPYRSPPTEPQFVCIACYGSMSVQPGQCQHCGVDRLPLGDPAVRAEVRAEAERRLQKRQYAEWFWCCMAAAMASLPILPLAPGLLGYALYLAATFTLVTFNVRLYERLRPNSALRLYADRRRRLAAVLSHKALPPHEDPEDAELPRVLAFLGAHVEK